MKKKDIIKKETIDTKILIDETRFESGVINILRTLSAERSQIINMFEDIDFYKNKGYKIQYYYDSKDKQLSYKALKKRGIGFIYEDGSKTKI